MPNLQMRDEFIGVLRDGLLKLVAEEANDPIKVFQKSIESMVESLKAELETTMGEPIPEGADRATVQNERFMSWLTSFQYKLMELGLSE